MSKILEASLNSAGVVMLDGKPLADAVVLSEGTGASTGLAILDEEESFYLAKTSPDLKTTLEKVVDALTQTKNALDKAVAALTKIDTHVPLVTSCGAGAGTATWTPVAASDIAAITTAATAIETAKTALNTLKGALR